MSRFPEINSLDAIRREDPNMLLMYSSWSGGMIRNPSLMMVPLDDHLVHRGDGVFEALKVIGNKPYLWDKHFKRLKVSAKVIGLELEKLPQLEEVVFEMCKEHQDLGHRLMRIFVARGPGSFTTNPYEPKSPQLYIILQRFKAPADKCFTEGVRIGISEFVPKGFPWSTVKSCNYLLNVMMKKEAVDRGLDYTIGFDGNTLTESSTENLAIFTKNNQLIFPWKKTILSGTTLERLCELVKESHPGFEIIEGKLTISDLENAAEVFMVGTTLDVVPVVEFEGKAIGSGRPGPLAAKFKKFIEDDQKTLGS